MIIKSQELSLIILHLTIYVVALVEWVPISSDTFIFFMNHQHPNSFSRFSYFTQTDDAPEKLLINVDVADLNESSKRKLKKYFEQDILSQETLKKNSYIDLETQLELASFIQSKLNRIHV